MFPENLYKSTHFQHPMLFLHDHSLVVLMLQNTARASRDQHLHSKSRTFIPRILSPSFGYRRKYKNTKKPQRFQTIREVL